MDVIFALAQAWCLSESDSDFELLEKRLEALTPDESILVRVWPVFGSPLPSQCYSLVSCDAGWLAALQLISMLTTAGSHRCMCHPGPACTAGRLCLLPAAQPAQRDGGEHHSPRGEGKPLPL